MYTQAAQTLNAITVSTLCCWRLRYNLNRLTMYENAPPLDGIVCERTTTKDGHDVFICLSLSWVKLITTWSAWPRAPLIGAGVSRAANQIVNSPSNSDLRLLPSALPTFVEWKRRTRITENFVVRYKWCRDEMKPRSVSSKVQSFSTRGVILLPCSHQMARLNLQYYIMRHDWKPVERSFRLDSLWLCTGSLLLCCVVVDAYKAKLWNPRLK